MFQGNSWRLGRIGGVEIKIDPSWAIIALLVGYSFFLILDDRFPEQSTGLTLPLAIVMAAFFFISVLLHELAHSWLARSRGVEVKGITLFLFGGATHADLETKEPFDELIIALVGPVSSIAIAGVFWAVTQPLIDTPVGYATGYLGWINLFLGIFNLLPGFPLDGGRVLRALVWRRTDNLIKATRIASRAGRILGTIIVAVGVFEIFFLGALIGGLWLIAIGWFLSQAATASFTHLQLKSVLQDVPASRVMTRDIKEMPAGITLRSAVDDYFLEHNYNTFPVVSDAEATGLVTMASIREVPENQWDVTLVDDVLEPLSEMCTVNARDTVGEVVPKLMQGEVGRVVVLEKGEIVGLITPRDLVRWLEMAQQLGDAEAQLRLR